MSSSSDNEEFFDAEADTPVKIHNEGSSSKASEKEKSTLKKIKEVPSDEAKAESASEVIPSTFIDKETEKRIRENERRRRKLEEMRRRMMSDDDDVANFSSPGSSCASSVDGISSNLISAPKVTPIIKEPNSETSSLMSLGKIGQLLASDTLSQQSTTAPILSPEPDIVASTKASERQQSVTAKMSDPSPSREVHVTTDEVKDSSTVPVRPPRKKKKKPPSVTTDNVSEDKTETQTLECGLPSPDSTIENIAKDLEFSLDIKSAIKGKYVVKPQDDDRSRASSCISNSNILIDDSDRILNQFENKSRESSLSSKYTIASAGNSLSGSRANSKPGSKTGSPNSTQDAAMFMRPRSDSGRQLTDLEILEQVTVLNLDTGERIPLSLAEDRLPQAINPLSLHIMRLTSEYVSNSDLEKDDGSDAGSVASISSKKESTSDHTDNGTMKRKATKFKKMIGRTVELTVNKIKSVADEVYHQKHGDDMESSDEDVNDGIAAPKNILKVKASSSHKGPYEFDNIKLVQELGSEHNLRVQIHDYLIVFTVKYFFFKQGAIWTMKFSYCGRLLATAGQDHILRIWVLKDSYSYFDDMRQKYNADARKVSPSPSQESLASYQSSHSTDAEALKVLHEEAYNDESTSTFISKPFCVYQGHTADVLDVSWSKNYFILSSSMDKTVRLWHISRKECLCCFQHIDFVTAIAFHPRDDRYFISGSLDGKLRLWNIPDKKVALWNEMEGPSKLITAANFCQNGKFAVVGSYDGRCVFYSTEQLKYYTQIHVRSTRGKNAKGRKITGIEPIPGEGKILVTSNDSRVRLYDLRDLSLSCKYKGYVNLSSQIKASFSHDGKLIISGSENHNIYIWKQNHDFSKFSSARRDRNDYWEGIKAHSAVVTSAVFAPNPNLVLRQFIKEEMNFTPESMPQGYVLVSADFKGNIKVFVNLNKDKVCSSFQQLLPSVTPQQ